MNGIHPHWHATDDGTSSAVSPPPQISAEHAMPAGRQVSRRPAAILGIGLVLAIGFVFVQGVESLTGQLAQSTDITISATGVIPKEVIVNPGDTLTFANEQDIPHILESTTLCGGDGTCMMTSTIFQGEKVDYTIPLDVRPGLHVYESTTSTDVTGTISITGGTAVEPEIQMREKRTSSQPDGPNTGGSDNKFVSVTDLLQQGLLGNNAIDALIDDTPTGTDPVPIAENHPRERSARSVIQQGGGLAALPQNPYTVGSEVSGPEIPSEVEMPESLKKQKDDEKKAQKKIVTKRRPKAQPSTGARDLIIFAIGASIIGFWIWMRRSTTKVVISNS